MCHSHAFLLRGVKMKDYIFSFVRSIGVAIVLRSKKINGILTYYLVDWLGNDGQYYSLLAMCNETQFVTKDMLLLGESKDSLEVNSLTSNLRQSASKSDWVIDKWDVSEIKKIDAFLEQKLQWINDLNCEELSINGYCVTSILLEMHPVFQYVVQYEYRGRLNALVLPMQQQMTLVAETRECYEFLSGILHTLGLTKYFTIDGEPHNYIN